MRKTLATLLTVTSMILTSSCGSFKTEEEVNVYSYRKEQLIRPLLDRFTEETGIKVNLVTGKADALFQRLVSEGANTPADVLLTVDAGRLHRAKQANLLQKIDSELLNDAVPEYLRDPDQQWFGLSYRARVIMYNKAKVSPEALSSYKALTDPKWQNRICMRSSGNIYNQSLLAALIHHHGLEAAENWAKGLVQNMARPPKGNDRSQMSGAAVGECDLTIANTYYLGKWIHSTDAKEQALADKIAIFFPNQNSNGTHINVSGAGITRYAKHKKNAQALLEFLVSDTAQQWYAEINHEYPVKNGINVSDTVQSWGYPFKIDTLNLNILGELNPEAVKVFDRAGWQ